MDAIMSRTDGKSSLSTKYTGILIYSPLKAHLNYSMSNKTKVYSEISGMNET